MKAMTQANQVIKQSLQNRLAGWLNWSMQTLNVLLEPFLPSGFFFVLFEHARELFDRPIPMRQLQACGEVFGNNIVI